MTDNKNSSKELKEKRVNTNVRDGLIALATWLEINILPALAVPVLAVLAADDIKIHLIKNVNHDVALLVGIAVAAVFAVLALGRKPS
jgi:hypothetical protein